MMTAYPRCPSIIFGVTAGAGHTEQRAGVSGFRQVAGARPSVMAGTMFSSFDSINADIVKPDCSDRHIISATMAGFKCRKTVVF